MITCRFVSKMDKGVPSLYLYPDLSFKEANGVNHHTAELRDIVLNCKIIIIMRNQKVVDFTTA